MIGLLINRNDVPWETLAPSVLAAFDPARPKIHFSAGFTIQGSGSGPVDVKITLPKGFDFDPGSATLASQPIADPTITGSTLEWQLTGVKFATAYTLSFLARAGTNVGPAQATEVVSAGTATSPTSIASFSVTDGFSNNTFTNASGITPGQNVEMSAILSPSEVDYYKIPLPAAGTRIEVHLTNLAADYDLALYANQSSTVRTGTLAPSGAPLQDGTVPDQQINLQGAGNSNAQLTPTALQDVPDPGVPVVQVSANRGTDDEDVGMVSPGPSTGNQFAYIAVYGYNGASSPQPYTLRVTTQTPQVASCTPRSFANAGKGTPGTLPSLASLPSNLNTLVLVDEKRIGDTYGAASETSVVNSLTSLVGRGDLGVSGAVIPVESIPGVQTDYNLWDANPCNNDAANAIANAIADQVDRVKASANGAGLKYVVFVGGDDEIPFFRIPDLSLIANESGFASQFTNNEYYGAAASGDLLTDNPYLDTRPVPASGRQLFIPDLVGGRLVETPTDITNAVTNFINSGGTLRSATAFVSGYDFVADGSQLVANRLSSILGTGSVRTLIDSTTPFSPATSWSKAQLIANAFPTGGPAAINDWNGHYDNTRALMANGTDLLSTSELTGSHALSGGIFFTMGCHAGFQTTDAIIGSPVLDWAQTMAGTGTSFVGNTGYGLGNTDSVAFSEELMADLASHLDGSLSIGQALVQAKQDYFLSRDAFSSYDEKTLSEAELYSLPMYGVGTPPAPLAPPGAGGAASPAVAAPLVIPAGPSDPVTGATSSSSPSIGLLSTFAGTSAQSAPFDVVPNFGSAPTSGQHGSYYTNGGQVQAPNYRPLQPYVSLPATQSNLVAHGVVIDALTSQDHSPFNPDNVRPTLDLSTKELEPQFDDEAWPSKIPTLVSLNSGASSVNQKLNLITGQFFDDTSGSTPVGVERLWTHIGGRVVYSNSSDFVPPTIDQMDAFTTGLGTVVFTGQFTDPGSTIVFAQVVYDKEDNTGQWAALQLQNGSGNTWSGTVPFTAGHIQFFVEVCDAAGNCGYSSNKGRYFDAQPLSAQTGAITLSPTTQPGSTGFYTGPVTVDASSSTGAALTESLDGGPYVAYPTTGVSVTGDGPHTLDVKGSDGSDASTVVLIDTGNPTAAINVPASIPYGAKVPFNFSCADAGSGVATCTGTQNGSSLANGALIATTTLGSVTLKVTATDHANNTTTVTKTVQIVKATPTITWPTPASIPFGTPLAAKQLNATASNAGAAVAGSFVYSPASGTVLQPGVQTLNLTFNPSDTAHYNSASASVQIVVTFSQACQTGTVSGSVTIKSGQVYCLGAGGKITGSVSVQSGGTLWVNGGTIAGSLSASGAKAITFCNASIAAAISISGSTGPVTLGSTTGCGGNRLLAAMSLSKNTGGVSLVGNTIGGAISVSSNKGGVTFANNKALAVMSFSSNAGGVTVTGNTIGGAVSVTSSTGGLTFTNNTITGALSIQNNTGGFVYTGNHVTGPTTIKNNT